MPGELHFEEDEERQRLVNRDDDIKTINHPNVHRKRDGVKELGYWNYAYALAKQTWVPVLANAFEWFEFSTFAYLIRPLSQNFTAGNNSLTWVLFSIAFVVRPLGGVTIGYIGDFFGRKPAFLISSATVICSTVLQGCVPSNRIGGGSWGTFGLIVLIILRVQQGLGIGGELGSGVVYMAEVSGRNCMGLAMGLLSVSGAFGFLASSSIVAMLNSTLSEDEMADWGWRIPFVAAALPGALLLYHIDGLPETSVFEDEVEGQSVSGWKGVKQLLTTQYDRILALFFMISGPAAMCYVGSVYVFDWVRGFSNLPDALWGAVLQFAVSAIVALPAGYLIDTYGLKLNFQIISSMLVVTVLPVFAMLLHTQSETAIFLGPGVLFGFVGGLLGPVSSVMATAIFSPKMRHRGIGIAYNSGVMLFGGLGPVWVELLLPATRLAPGYYCLVTSLISVLAYFVAGRRLLPKEEPSGHKY